MTCGVVPAISLTQNTFPMINGKTWPTWQPYMSVFQSPTPQWVHFLSLPPNWHVSRNQILVCAILCSQLSPFNETSVYDRSLLRNVQHGSNEHQMTAYLQWEIPQVSYLHYALVECCKPGFQGYYRRQMEYSKGHLGSAQLLYIISHTPPTFRPNATGHITKLYRFFGRHLHQ